MYVEPHDLAHEFPNLTQAIDELRAKDPRFAALFEQYHAVNGEVVTLEERDVPVDDFTIEELKKTRLKLKDEIYERLRAHLHAA
jgi:uncharacterized protein YdcH (DUF465 family)